MSVRHVFSVNGSDEKHNRNAILKDNLQFTQMLSFEQSNYFLCIANFLCFDYSNFVHESFDLQENKKTLEIKAVIKLAINVKIEKASHFSYYNEKK